MLAVYDDGFNATLFEIIDRALSSTLGGEEVTALYNAVQAKCNLPGEQFQKRPLDVVRALSSILSCGGFRLVEERILDQIRRSFRLYDGGITDLAQMVAFAKCCYMGV
ncbi:MAG TPA: hypothetical protein VFF30_14685 [Nitrososphaerales archaeon]|nr:hypothetical protein [Nitrososphaerales archaeon]